MKKGLLLFAIIGVLGLVTGCGKLSDKVQQKESKIKVGSKVNLVEQFQCAEGVSIGIDNADAFDSSKVGSYSVDVTIISGDEQEKKTYIFDVYDDEKPQMEGKDVTIYEKEKLTLEELVTCTDNSGETIKPEIVENNVDVNKAGSYVVKFSAKDSSDNISEKQINVTVKKKYNFKEIKKLVREILKKKEYKGLVMDKSEDKDIVWVEVSNKAFSSKENSQYFYWFRPYWAVAKPDGEKNANYRVKLFVELLCQSKEEYISPENMYIRSEKDKIKSDSDSVEYDYVYELEYSIFSDMQFMFTDSESINKFCDMIDANNIKFTGYTDKKTFRYTLNGRDKKEIQKMINFYNEISQYL